MPSGINGAAGSSDGSAGSGGSSSTSNAGGSSGGSSGSVAQAGGAGSGQSGSAGANVDAGAAPDSSDHPSDAAAEAKGPDTFACSELLGPNVAGEWFDAGFENLVPNDLWQVKAPHHSFVEDWANPNHAVWRETGCDSTYFNCETKSKCKNGGMVDRIVFVTQQGDYLNTTQQAWQDVITSAIATFKVKYPMLKHVELMTFIRVTNNMDCGGETTISPNLDKAHQALAAASNGFITVAPHFEVNMCNLFSGSPHMTAQGNMIVANLLGAYFK